MPIVATVRSSLYRFPVKLYLTLIVQLLIPTIYKTFRVAILGSLPNTGAISIAAQMQWLGVLLEIIEEGLLQPLYYCLGITIRDHSATRNKVKTGFIVSLGIYAIFAAVMSAATDPLVTWMGQSPTLHAATVTYIRLELAGIVFGSLGKFLLLIMVLKKWNKMIFLALFVQMSTSVLLDDLLVAKSMYNLGANGVAYSSMGSGFCVLVTGVVICWSQLDFDLFDLRHQYDFGWFRHWTRVGFFSALDSLIRNAVYLVVVLRAMNLLDQQDAYWVTNTLIWSWLLLPVLPLADVMKQDVGTGSTSPIPHWRKLAAYMGIVLFIVCLWAMSYPLWRVFVTNVLRAADPDLVVSLAIQLVPCYAFFAAGNLMSAVLYGLGRTDLLVCGAFVGNVILVVLFSLMMWGPLPNTVRMVAGIFGAGLVCGGFIRTLLYIFVVRRHREL